MSNLRWGVWGVFQAKYSKINYDFMTYGVKRLKWFRDWKEEVINLTKQNS